MLLLLIDRPDHFPDANHHVFFSPAAFSNGNDNEMLLNWYDENSAGAVETGESW